VALIHNGVLVSYKEKSNLITRKQMDEMGDHSEWGWPASEDQKSYVLPHMHFTSRSNAAMWVDLGHTLRGEHIWEVWA
jgi:hypothetical protein